MITNAFNKMTGWEEYVPDSIPPRSFASWQLIRRQPTFQPGRVLGSIQYKYYFLVRIGDKKPAKTLKEMSPKDRRFFGSLPDVAAIEAQGPLVHIANDLFRRHVGSADALEKKTVHGECLTPAHIIDFSKSGFPSVDFSIRPADWRAPPVQTGKWRRSTSLILQSKVRGLTSQTYIHFLSGRM